MVQGTNDTITYYYWPRLFNAEPYYKPKHLHKLEYKIMFSIICQPNAKEV